MFGSLSEDLDNRLRVLLGYRCMSVTCDGSPVLDGLQAARSEGGRQAPSLPFILTQSCCIQCGRECGDGLPELLLGLCEPLLQVRESHSLLIRFAFIFLFLQL